MKNILHLLLIAVVVSTTTAFTPTLFGTRKVSSLVLFAKHVQKKACKRKAHNRPKKTNPSRKNQKPTVYELYSIPEPPEYGVVEESEDAPQLYKDADEIRKIMMEKFEYSTLKEVTPKGPFDQPIPPEKLDTRTGLEPNFDVESIGSASP